MLTPVELAAGQQAQRMEGAALAARLEAGRGRYLSELVQIAEQMTRPTGLVTVAHLLTRTPRPRAKCVRRVGEWIPRHLLAGGEHPWIEKLFAWDKDQTNIMSWGRTSRFPRELNDGLQVHLVKVILNWEGDNLGDWMKHQRQKQVRNLSSWFYEWFQICT